MDAKPPKTRANDSVEKVSLAPHEADICESEKTQSDGPRLVDCWRCGKQFGREMRTCPYCFAANQHAPAVVASRSSSESERGTSAVRVALFTYASLLAIGLIQGAVTYVTVQGHVAIDLSLAKTLVLQLSIAESVSTLAVIAALILCGRLPPRRRPIASHRVAAWVGAVPLLAVAMAGNFTYHWLIRTYTSLPIIRDELFQFSDVRSLFLVLIVLTCLQPPIVEEMFARYLLLGVFRNYMSTAAAVWVSAIAFGMLHIGVPLSVPYLIFLGAVLGYLRVWSGSMLLPILFHLAHNAVFVAIEVVS